MASCNRRTRAFPRSPAPVLLHPWPPRDLLIVKLSPSFSFKLAEPQPPLGNVQSAGANCPAGLGPEGGGGPPGGALAEGGGAPQGPRRHARRAYLSWRGSQSTPGSSSRAAWRTSSLSMEKLRRWPACATATRIHSISGGSTRKGLRQERAETLGGEAGAPARPHPRPPTGPPPSPPRCPWRPGLGIPRLWENLWRHPERSGDLGAGSPESLDLSFLICKTGIMWL